MVGDGLETLVLDIGPDMVLQVFADAGQIVMAGNAMLPKLSCIANTGQHQEMGRLIGAGREQRMGKWCVWVYCV